MKMWKLAGLGCAVAAAALSFPRPGDAEDVYRLHALLPLTGYASFIGKDEEIAAKAIEKWVNKTGGIQGHPLQIVVHDDQSNPQVSVQLAKQIFQDNPAVILGPGLVAPCKAVAPLLKTGPLAYCLAPGSLFGNYMFSSGAATEDLMAAMIRYFRLKGWKRIAVISTSDAPGQDGDNAIDRLMKLPENRDVTIVTHPHFAQGDLSVSAQMESIKAAAPQAMIAWVTGVSIATVFRGMTQAGLDLPIGVSNGNMIRRQMKQYGEFLPKQLYFAATEWTEGVTAEPAVAAAKEIFYTTLAGEGVKPDLPTALFWDPAMLYITALRALGTNATAPQVRDYLAHLKGFSGINGPYDFDKYPQRGIGLEDTLLTRWMPDKATWLIVSKPTGIPLEN